MVNKDTLAGQWKQIKGKIKEKWGDFTDNELTQIDGKKDVMVGKLQEKYGYSKDKAEEEWKNFCSSCNPDERPEKDKSSKK